MKRFDSIDGPLSGMNLVEASAGTGKTYTITTLFVRLLVETGLSLKEILVVTFTEAATSELKSRIRARLAESLRALTTGEAGDELIEKYLEYPVQDLKQATFRISRALSDFDEAAVYTIHSFCKRMLKDNAFESGVLFDMDLIKDQTTILTDIVHDFWAVEIYDASPTFVRYLRSTRTNPEGLVALAKKTAQGIETEIIPGAVSPKEAEPRFLAACENARAIWQASRDEITKLLLGHTGLKANMFKPENMALWFERVDNYLAGKTPPAPLPTSSTPGKAIDHCIARLTASRIESGTKKNSTAPRHIFFDACEEILEASEHYGALLLDFKLRLIHYARSELARRKEIAGNWSFDDLLFNLDRALDGPGGRQLTEAIRARFGAAMIDEFQDTDHVQYRIFKKLYGQRKEPLFLIGDPKQSIYAFRGADIFAYLDAARHTGDSARTLDTNWRSDPLLLDGINTLFQRIQRPFVFDGIDYPRVQAREGASDTLKDSSDEAVQPLQIRFVARKKNRLDRRGFIAKNWLKENLPALVATDIARLISGGMTVEGRPVEARDIAVLTRTNKQAREIQTALSRTGIPSTLWSAESVFKSNEAMDLARLLAAVAEPDSSSRIRAALGTDLVGLSGNEILSLTEDDAAWDRWAGAFRSWHEQWRDFGFVGMMRTFLAFRFDDTRPAIGIRLLGYMDGERRMTNTQQLIELLHEASISNHLGMTGLLRWLAGQRVSPSTETDGLRLESDRSAVRLTTVHKAKGLEFPIVYCPNLWDGYLHVSSEKEVIYHDSEEGFQRRLDIGSKDLDAHRSVAKQEEMAENMRLLYVALTRAKHLLVIYWGGMAGMRTSPLGYLLHQDGRTDAEMLEELNELVRVAPENAIRLNDVDEALDYNLSLVDGATSTDFEPMRLTRPIPATAAMSSFSGLASAGEALGASEIEGRDRDEAADGIDAVSEKGKPLRESNENARVILADFHRGPRAGNCLHAIFEHLDFTNEDSAEIEYLVERNLSAFGFEVDTWKETVCRATHEILDTPLDPKDARVVLRSIPRANTLRELEFLFPIHGNIGSITSADIASVFAEHGGKSVPATYIKHLERLGASMAPGFLKGFVDLVFEQNGRYYLVDYKSNFLGSEADNYANKDLQRAMIQHDYFLQYHLYVTALHRYLGYRLPGYDYNIHFGSVYYLFLRGMSPRTGHARGVFRDRPPGSLITALSDLMDKTNDMGGAP
ncbi:MAG: exodeoxyribonuclease V subunit beta [Deltaproteobacteria bacterium]|nr:exodeoxyribonuclease V subunit beta [Deltaproteobacteria bacterium]